ncbi:SDR family oxidoreductase [Proteiniclasticum sp. SCR006]|uniref:SDR family oxidoreductase n=1 Tax=Proteiniclasticum aestuarii TaxID=2817862 RepID=A0A939KH94_9CLOT|nr:SDR family oxidoreductase [Proteiniclasticum aestuarii]MBO1266352.1 SDR family oxidoreductase [Proteiniclasticum aestuarii]
MEGYALVTGATSGIGLEIALNFARDGIHLILVARREEKLNEIRDRIEAQYGVKVLVLAKDLTREEAPDEIHEEVEKRGIRVDYLINNAGFGSFGRLKDTDYEKEKDLVKLNVLSLLQMNKLFIPAMVERHFGYVMNVASLAAFMPGPVMANYYASKAYVLSLSEAMHEELKEEGVKVSALCPGPVRTEFQERAEMKKTDTAKAFIMEAKKVADAGYLGLWRGKAVVIPGTFEKMVPVLTKLMPRCLVRKAAFLSQKE